MSSKSKIKGATFERDIAKFLSNLYSSSFTRAAHSGAYIGGKNSFRKNTLSEGQIRSFKGDIVPPDDWKLLNIECKNYAAFPFHRLLFSEPVPLLEEWLKQLMDVADEKDVNVLFMKITRIGTFVAYESEMPFVTTRHIEYTDKNSKKWYLSEFNNFFEHNTTEFRNTSLGAIPRG